jgi:uncharacterized Fe-S cluster protein YjdI/CDGSH-type Zn-finger protein
MAQSKVHRYESTATVVTWDAKRCIHAAECVHTLPEVFDPDAKPWIRPDAAEAAALRSAVDRCPTGALAMHGLDGKNVALQPATNTGLLMPGGPLYLRGKLKLQVGDGVQDETRMALCRCSHQKVGFKDPGALAATSVPEPGTDLHATLTITPTTDGPVKCDGPLTLHGSGGRTAFATQTFLCRCGGSRNKPYCDGTHRTIGFAG